VGQRPSDKKRVLGMYVDGLSYRLGARNVGMSKNTVMEIIGRSATFDRLLSQRSVMPSRPATATDWD
jgi:hypothetical protein